MEYVSPPKIYYQPAPRLLPQRLPPFQIDSLDYPVTQSACGPCWLKNTVKAEAATINLDSLPASAIGKLDDTRFWPTQAGIGDANDAGVGDHFAVESSRKAAENYWPFESLLWSCHRMLFSPHNCHLRNGKKGENARKVVI